MAEEVSEEVFEATRIEDSEGFRERLLEKLSDLVDEHLPENLKLDLSSLLSGKINIDWSGYMDKLVTELIKRMEDHKLSSVELPDMQGNFSQDLCCLRLPGEAKFSDIVLSGFTSLKRFTPAQVNVDVTGDKVITASTSLGIEQLGFCSPTALNILFLESNTVTKAVLKDVKLDIGVGLGRDMSVAVDTFDVKSTGKLTDFAGLPDSVLESVQSLLEKAVSDKVQKLLQTDVKELMAEIVQQLKLLF